MKKLYFTFAILVCSMGIAQNKPAAKAASNANPLSFGVKVGMNLAKLTDLNNAGSYSSDFRYGLTFGGFVNYKFKEKFAFHPELLYTAQGLVQKENSTGYKLIFKMDYIAVPLMFRYYPGNKFDLEFGPQLAFNINKKIESKAGSSTSTMDIDDYFTSNGLDAKTSTFDLALNIGGGYEILKGLNFDARYSYGLIKVFKGPGVTDSNGKPETIKNSVFTFGFAYSFR